MIGVAAIGLVPRRPGQSDLSNGANVVSQLERLLDLARDARERESCGNADRAVAWFEAALDERKAALADLTDAVPDDDALDEAHRAATATFAAAAAANRAGSRDRKEALRLRDDLDAAASALRAIDHARRNSRGKASRRARSAANASPLLTWHAAERTAAALLEAFESNSLVREYAGRELDRVVNGALGERRPTDDERALLWLASRPVVRSYAGKFDRAEFRAAVDAVLA